MFCVAPVAAETPKGRRITDTSDFEGLNRNGRNSHLQLNSVLLASTRITKQYRFLTRVSEAEEWCPHLHGYRSAFPRTRTRAYTLYLVRRIRTLKIQSLVVQIHRPWSSRSHLTCL